MRLVALALLLAACRPPGYGKGDDEPMMIDAPKPAPDVVIDAPATTCDKTFRLDGMGGATTVWLTGTFTNWGGNPGAGAVELTKGADDAWTVLKTMDAGAHQYKFIIDGGNWIADPANPNFVDDGFGGRNSLYTCSP